MTRRLITSGLAVLLAILILGCAESPQKRKVVETCLDGFSLGQTPDPELLARSFESAPQGTATHRVSLSHYPFVVYLDGTQKCCQIEGESLDLTFDDGTMVTVTAGQTVEQLEELLRGSPWERKLDVGNGHILEVPQGYLFLQIAKTESYPLFGLTFYVRRQSILNGFCLMSESHQKLSCPPPRHRPNEAS